MAALIFILNNKKTAIKLLKDNSSILKVDFLSLALSRNIKSQRSAENRVPTVSDDYNRFTQNQTPSDLYADPMEGAPSNTTGAVTLETSGPTNPIPPTDSGIVVDSPPPPLPACEKRGPTDLATVLKDEYEKFILGNRMLQRYPPENPIPAHLARYSNIPLTPTTRVMLEQIEGDGNSTFIHANYISDQQTNDKAYIATQGPFVREPVNTIGDFWRMIWENDVRTIVMVTGLVENGRPKCAQYWPLERSKAGITVTSNKDKDAKEHPDESYMDHRYKYPTTSTTPYTIEDLVVEKEMETRNVRHFWYTTWPDMGVPKDKGGVLDMLNEVQVWQLSQQSTAPIVVHCSAGVGRTGTIIGIDIGMKMLNADCKVNVYNLIDNMRKERGGMVQQPAQAKFIQDCLEAYAVPSQQSLKSKIFTDRKGLNKQPSLKYNQYLIREKEGQIYLHIGPELGKTIVDNPLRSSARLLKFCDKTTLIQTNTYGFIPLPDFLLKYKTGPEPWIIVTPEGVEREKTIPDSSVVKAFCDVKEKELGMREPETGNEF